MVLSALHAPGLANGPAAGTACPVRGGHLRVVHFSDAVGLDPHLATAMTSTHIYEQVYETLITYDAELAPQPALAEAWDISADGKTYTFRLRKGVKFTNGRELVASDVLYSVQRLEELGGTFSSRFEYVESLEAPDEYTVVFRLQEPLAPFLSTLADPKAAIVPREVVEQHGDLRQVMVGTGPFILQSISIGNEYHFVRNPEYWEPNLPCVDEMTIRIIEDEATRISALRIGEADIVPLTQPISVQVVGRTPGVRVELVPLLQRNVLVVQTEVEPLNDVRVRQALMLATDREAILRAVQQGQGVVSGLFPPGLGIWAQSLEQLPFYEQDVERAQQLLREAGYPNGFSVEIKSSPAYGIHIPIAQVLQQQWRRIGVDVRIQSLEWGVLLDHWGKGTFEIISMSYGGRTDPYFYTYERFHSESSGNASRFRDAELDELMVRGMTETDMDERIKLYNEIELGLVEKAPIIYLTTGVERFGMRDRVQNFSGVPMGTRPNYKYIYLDNGS